ncbi:MAG: BrnA antitoxin family protein [Betaproteobacteria bacterium]|nr:BrnA antitoxin family protein [Betaproteobacteria bacterium]
MKPTSITEMPDILDCDDAPELTQADFDRARYRIGGKDVTRVQWQEAVRAQVKKQRVTIMLDTPIIEHFKTLAGNRGYQTLINETLRRIVEDDSLVLPELRRIIREEVRAELSASRKQGA